MAQRERLDFEDDEERAARLGNLFTSMSNPAAGSDAIPAFPQPPSRPFAMPESDVLARARAFLPLLAASNADILSRAAADPSSVVIDSPNPAQGGNMVAMDVGLGVFDVKGEALAGEGMGPVVERDAEVWAKANEESEEDDDDDDEDDEEDSGENDDDAEDVASELQEQKKQPKVVEI